MSDLFFGVDIQRDFMDETGLLYVPGAEDIKPNIQRLYFLAAQHTIPQILSADDHEYHDPEISLGEPDPANGIFWPHCMRGTTGAQLIPEAGLRPDAVVVTADTPCPLVDTALDQAGDGPDQILILKKHFNVFTNPHVPRLLGRLSPITVYVYGVATDVCVDAAVSGLLNHNYEVVVVLDAIAGISEENCKTSMEQWGQGGASFITVDDLEKRLRQQESLRATAQISEEYGI